MSDIRIATDPDGISSLRRLTSLLSRVAHPSIVAVESTRFEARRAEVTLAAVKGTPLSQASLELEPLMRVIAATSAALAHLHGHGVSLGTLDPETIMVRHDHSIVLTGLDDAIEDAPPTDKSSNIKELATVAQSLVPTADPLRSRINNDSSIEMHSAFQKILDDAGNGKLNARALAEQIRHALWFDNKPNFKTRTTKHRHSRTQRFSKRKIAFLGLAAIIGVSVIGTIQLAPQPKVAATKVSKGAAPSCELRTNATMDIDGDGCMDSLHIDGGIVTINNERFTAGTPEDTFLVGDWQCNNRPTLVMLQKASGTIYTFDTWPLVGMHANARMITTIPGATDLEKYRRNACDTLTVHTPSGTQDIDVRKVQP